NTGPFHPSGLWLSREKEEYMLNKGFSVWWVKDQMCVCVYVWCVRVYIYVYLCASLCGGVWVCGWRGGGLVCLLRSCACACVPLCCCGVSPSSSLSAALSVCVSLSVCLCVCVCVCVCVWV